MKFIAVILVCAPMVAQDSMHDALVKHWKVSSEFTMQVAKAMPAESRTLIDTAPRKAVDMMRNDRRILVNQMAPIVPVG